MRFLALVTALVFPVLSFAANLYFVPSKIETNKGQNFLLDIYLDTNEKIYTSKLVLQFDPKYLQLQSFKFWPNSIALTQAGYDLLDNTNGKLIKTAGFPSGIEGKVKLASVEFLAKSRVDLSKVKIAQNESMLLNSSNNNALDSATEAEITIKEKLVKQAAKSSVAENNTPKTTTKEEKGDEKQSGKAENSKDTKTNASSSKENVSNDNTSQAKINDENTQLAFAAFAGKYVYAILIFIILVLLAVIFVLIKKKV